MIPRQPRLQLFHRDGLLRQRLAGSFVGPVLKLVSGVILAQAVVFAGRPVLTRLFTPDEFGVLTLFVTLIAIVATLTTGHYEDAGLLPASNKDAAGLYLLALGMAATGAVLIVLILPWRGEVASLLNTPALAPALVLLPVGILMAGWGQIIESWHSRQDRFGLISVGRFIQSCVVVGFQIAAGVLGADSLGLTGGAVLGFCALVFVIGIPLLLRDHVILAAAFRRETTLNLAKRYRRFPLFSTPAAFLNLVASRIAVFLLAVFFGTTTVGLFGLAYGTLALPVSLITGSIGQVFAVRAPVAFLENRLGPLTNQVFGRLIAVAIFPMAAVAVAGPDLFALVFGEPWREAGVYAAILSPWLCVMSVASPLTRLFDVTERQRGDLGFSVVLLAAQVVALAIAARSAEPQIGIAAVSVAGLVSRSAQIVWMLRLGSASLSQATRTVIGHGLLAAILLFPAGLAVYLEMPVLWTIAALVIAGAIYAVAVIRMDWKSSDGSNDFSKGSI